MSASTNGSRTSRPSRRVRAARDGCPVRFSFHQITRETVTLLVCRARVCACPLQSVSICPFNRQSCYAMCAMVSGRFGLVHGLGIPRIAPCATSESAAVTHSVTCPQVRRCYCTRRRRTPWTPTRWRCFPSTVSERARRALHTGLHAGSRRLTAHLLLRHSSWVKLTLLQIGSQGWRIQCESGLAGSWPLSGIVDVC